ncbi:potassium channel family protein [Haloflavibacter putidus]|uniref:Potassium transporter TrkA n=1 Tax=Haloflavibacter putidus TaxID=2576776 RepID=A0A507ZER0_9FLAO|nr:NAD-binding protein [Haloflavibacter putidus]TQD36256.1 potassium transporter TrkA [Haloflavibacter putidus]
MKFVGSQLAYYVKDREFKRNSKILFKYLIVLAIVVVVFSVLFHFIMEIEGQNHSWVTGFYWTLTVMSTLGFGDITFASDLGRAFSIVVLLSGIFMLLIVLPFAFIRHFYVPLLESKKKNKVPRQVPSKTKDHILICSYDIIAKDLTERLQQDNTPYYVIESDLEKALENHDNQIPVLYGELDDEDFFKAVNINDARLVLVNKNDVVNTKIILTIRKIAPTIPIVAIATAIDSVDVQQLSGADHVLPLKKWLGEQLANRVNAQYAKSQPIGQYEDLLIAELPIHNTPLVSKFIRETNLRQDFGVSIVGIWERGKLEPITGKEELTQDSVLVIIGNKNQLDKIDALFHDYNVNPNPVLVIGAGRVGLAAAESLHKNGVMVNVVDKDPLVCKKARPFCNQVFAGDASDYELLKKAGILEAPSVLLSTHDDTMNIYLASYCRQLNKELRIVSRITEARNIDIIHKAGADFVLSYSTLGAEAVLSIFKGQELTVLGEGITLFILPIPKSLEGKSLAESQIGAKTGLSVIAIKEDSEVSTQLSADTQLPTGAEIVMLGNGKMKRKFNKIYVHVD